MPSVPKSVVPKTWMKPPVPDPPVAPAVELEPPSPLAVSVALWMVVEVAAVSPDRLALIKATPPSPSPPSPLRPAPPMPSAFSTSWFVTVSPP
jgi:hypothetical protein